MLFQNAQIEIESLPTAENTEFRHLAPAYLKSSYIASVIFCTILLIGLIAAFLFTDLSAQPILPYVLPIIWAIFTTFTFLHTKKEYQWQGYTLREKDILYRKGVIWRSVIAVPFNRVQHCEIKQGPIDRIFNLKTLDVYTAGGQSSDLSIPGLLGDDAQQLKEFIVKNTTADAFGDEEE